MYIDTYAYIDIHIYIYIYIYINNNQNLGMTMVNEEALCLSSRLSISLSYRKIMRRKL